VPSFTFAPDKSKSEYGEHVIKLKRAAALTLSLLSGLAGTAGRANHQLPDALFFR